MIRSISATIPLARVKASSAARTGVCNRFSCSVSSARRAAISAGSSPLSGTGPSASIWVRIVLIRVELADCAARNASRQLTISARRSSSATVEARPDSIDTSARPATFCHSA